MTAPRRILCIEDNAMNWRLVQRLLSQAGYEMHWAEDGLQGYEMALELKPVLILLDINLPGLSGFEVATKLRRSEVLDGAVIVALTAKTMRSDRETALVTGCDGFISKPIDPFLFVGQVESYLGGQRDRLEQGREGAALRQFSQKVVEHLEAQLREAQEGNRKLLDAQGALEIRSQQLSRLLSLSRDIIPIRDATEILSRVLGRLREELGLDRLRAYRLHASGTYFTGLAWGREGAAEVPALPGEHPLVAAVGALPPGEAFTDASLRQGAVWDGGLDLDWWSPKAHAFLVPLHSRSEEGRIWGLLCADRMDRPFQPFEVELVALHAGILQVSLENSELIAHLDETSRALGTSYEGLESAYASLKEAQQALGAQDRKTVLGGLFMQMAQRLLVPVRTLQDESLVLSRAMDPVEGQAPVAPEDCHLAMEAIHRAISQVDSLVRALLRRAGQGEANIPGWIHLHDMIQQELDLMQAEGSLPEDLALDCSFQAPRDLIYGVYGDFADLLRHLMAHALGGAQGRLKLRTWGGKSHFRMELEDEGGAIPQGLLAQAFEPFTDLRGAEPSAGRRPGLELPVCTQLMTAYGGTLHAEPTDRGTIIRLSLPMD